MKVLFFLILFMTGGLMSAQTEIAFQNGLNGAEIIKVSIDNFINIFNTPISTFKSVLVSHGYNLSTTENDCYNYVKESSKDYAIHEVSKCSGYMVSIYWFSKNPNQSNLDTFIEEIEKYYVGYDSKMSMPVYNVAKGDFVYQFYLSRKSTAEGVYCKRYPK